MVLHSLLRAAFRRLPALCHQALYVVGSDDVRSLVVDELSHTLYTQVCMGYGEVGRSKCALRRDEAQQVVAACAHGGFRLWLGSLLPGCHRLRPCLPITAS